MGRLTRAVILAACGALLTGCGEPFVVLGDTPGIMRVVLGVGDSVGTRFDSVATRTRLTQPAGVAFNVESGILYVGDRGAVRQAGGITTPVARVFSVSSRGVATRLLDGGGCTLAPCMLQPTAMTVTQSGSLIIADGIGHRVYSYIPYGTPTVIAGNGTSATAADGVPAATAPISRPSGVAVDSDGNIYIAEAGGHRIRRIDASGLLQTVAGTGTPGHSGDGGPATAAQLNEPAGLVVHNGSIYFTDVVSHVIRRIDAQGVITTLAGAAGGAGFSGDGGPALDATLNRPTALAITPDGRQLFVSDEGNDRVRAIDLVTLGIRTFAGTGSRAWSGNRRLAGETSLFRPAGLNAASNGFLFIADAGHSVVWRTSITAN